MAEEPIPPKLGPSGKAVIGWTVGMLGTLIALGGCGIHCHRALHRSTHPGWSCKSNLRQVGLACHMYADDNDGQMPTDLGRLMPRYSESMRIFECPGGVAYDYYGTKKYGNTFRADRCDYTLEPGLHADMPEDYVLAYDKTLEKHGGKGSYLLFVDAHVEWSLASCEAEFQEKLAAQREAVRKWRAAGAKKEDMDRFFGKVGEKKQK